jgi:5-methylcytosine-specific restriction endonuclease McrA
LSEFKKLVKNSDSITDILRKLGYKNKSGAIHKSIKERIDNEGLNVDHMLRLNSKHLRNVKNKTPMVEILVKDSKYTNNTSLKKRIISENIVEYKCCGCGNEGEWMDRVIKLQLDHINGIRNDNRLNNLRFLCPNCHSQTDTYAGKNYGKYIN